MAKLREIIGYLILTDNGTVSFKPGPEFPTTLLCREVLACGHTQVTPRFEGKLNTARSRRCDKCAAQAPADIPKPQMAKYLARSHA